MPCDNLEQSGALRYGEATIDGQPAGTECIDAELPVQHQIDVAAHSYRAIAAADIDAASELGEIAAGRWIASVDDRQGAERDAGARAVIDQFRPPGNVAIDIDRHVR